MRAVFYARVSTEEEKQLNALDKQIQENKDVIEAKGWDLVDKYIDEGKSGTTTKHRDEYKRLYNDMQEGKFDVIVIKSQDRLMRSTKEWYTFVDRLVQNDLKLYIYLEHDFYKTDNSLITGIRAIMAEEYSRDLSKKLNNANKRRIEQAKAGEDFKCMGSGQTYGYYIIDGEWFIDEEQARVVRETFRLYTELHSIPKTRDALTEAGYLNQQGRPFVPDTIRRILRNEMHKGTLVLNRNYRDFDKKKILTRPKGEWVYIENKIPAIVSKELWDKVNTELDSKITAGGRGVKNSKYPLSNKLYCKHCNKLLWAKKAQGKYLQWRCSGYLQHGNRGCNKSPSISDRQLRDLYTKLFSNVEANRSEVKATMVMWLNSLKESLTQEQVGNSTLQEIERLKRNKNKLTEAYMDEIISKDDYREKYGEIEAKIKELTRTLKPRRNKDLDMIDIVLKNIDKEIDTYTRSTEFEEGKIDWFISHTRRAYVGEDKSLQVELDTIAGAVVGTRVIST